MLRKKEGAVILQLICTFVKSRFSQKGANMYCYDCVGASTVKKGQFAGIY